jgi:hypothetical protein
VTRVGKQATPAGRLAAFAGQLATPACRPITPAGELVTFVYRLAASAIISRRVFTVSSGSIIIGRRFIADTPGLTAKWRRLLAVSRRQLPDFAACLSSRHVFFPSCPVFCSGKKPKSATLCHNLFAQCIAQQEFGFKWPAYQN